jgi:hypothetical protein
MDENKDDSIYSRVEIWEFDDGSNQLLAFVVYV